MRVFVEKMVGFMLGNASSYCDGEDAFLKAPIKSKEGKKIADEISYLRKDPWKDDWKIEKVFLKSGKDIYAKYNESHTAEEVLLWKEEMDKKGVTFWDRESFLKMGNAIYKSLFQKEMSEELSKLKSEDDLSDEMIKKAYKDQVYVCKGIFPERSEMLDYLKKSIFSNLRSEDIFDFWDSGRLPEAKAFSWEPISPELTFVLGRDHWKEEISKIFKERVSEEMSYNAANLFLKRELLKRIKETGCLFGINISYLVEKEKEWKILSKKLEDKGRKNVKVQFFQKDEVNIPISKINFFALDHGEKGRPLPSRLFKEDFIQKWRNENLLGFIDRPTVFDITKITIGKEFMEFDKEKVRAVH